MFVILSAAKNVIIVLSAKDLSICCGKQLQKRLGLCSPAIRYRPDEESGAAAAVGFRGHRLCYYT